MKLKKRGGKIDFLSISPRININVEIPNVEIEFAKSKLSNATEYCGKYVINKSCDIESGCILKREGDNPGRVSRSGRNLCVIYDKELYAIVWHTHPYHSKFYPSYEDIAMVKKERNGEKIKLSVIYTSIGIWLLESVGESMDEFDKDYIEEQNTELYNNCYKGRIGHPDFDLTFVLFYINTIYIPNMTKPECGMNILFKEYTSGQTINFILENVRLDSLTEETPRSRSRSRSSSRTRKHARSESEPESRKRSRSR